MNVERPKHMVLYDGECSFCTFQIKLLTWLDWFHVLSLRPVMEETTIELVPGLTREQLMEAIHCLSRDGRLYRGARCIRFVGMRVPLLVPMALVLWFPGVIWIAERIYAWVSRNRYLLSRLFGCKDACALLPARRPVSSRPPTDVRS